LKKIETNSRAESNGQKKESEGCDRMYIKADAIKLQHLFILLHRQTMTSAHEISPGQTSLS
jgi:hypothetical protein